MIWTACCVGSDCNAQDSGIMVPVVSPVTGRKLEVCKVENYGKHDMCILFSMSILPLQLYSAAAGLGFYLATCNRVTR